MAGLDAKVDQLLEGHRETRATLKELTAAVHRLSVIEERQTNANQAIDRAFSEIKQVEINAINSNERLGDQVKKHAEQTDARLKKLEEASPLNSMANGMVFKVGGLILAAVVGAFISNVLRPVSPPPIMIQGAPAAPATGAPQK